MPLQTYRQYFAPPPEPVNTLLSLRGQDLQRRGQDIQKGLGEERNRLLSGQIDQRRLELGEKDRTAAMGVLAKWVSTINPDAPDAEYQKAFQGAAMGATGELGLLFKDRPEVTEPMAAMLKTMAEDTLDQTKLPMSRELVRSYRAQTLGQRRWAPTTKEEALQFEKEKKDIKDDPSEWDEKKHGLEVRKLNAAIKRIEASEESNRLTAEKIKKGETPTPGQYQKALDELRISEGELADLEEEWFTSKSEKAEIVRLKKHIARVRAIVAAGEKAYPPESKEKPSGRKTALGAEALKALQGQPVDTYEVNGVRVYWDGTTAEVLD